MLRERGAYVLGRGARSGTPRSCGRASSPLVTDGPFAETKEARRRLLRRRVREPRGGARARRPGAAEPRRRASRFSSCPLKHRATVTGTLRSSPTAAATASAHRPVPGVGRMGSPLEQMKRERCRAGLFALAFGAGGLKTGSILAVRAFDARGGTCDRRLERPVDRPQLPRAESGSGFHAPVTMISAVGAAARSRWTIDVKPRFERCDRLGAALADACDVVSCTCPATAGTSRCRTASPLSG